MTPFLRRVDVAVGPPLSRLRFRLLLEFARYAMLSAFALLVDFGILVFATEVVGFRYLFAGALGFCVGVVIVYLGSVAWVFEQRQLDDAKMEFGVFVAIGVVGLVLNELILWLGTGFLPFHYSQSKVAAAGIVFLSNYATRKYLLFRETK